MLGFLSFFFLSLAIPVPQENIAISGTHTHSGPGGFQQYVLYQVTTLGFVSETFNAWVEGISQAIIKAHNNLQPAKTLLNSGLLYDSNINRSPTSYLLNPSEEQAQYPEGDTDKRMLLLSFLSDKHPGMNKPIGMLNWFAVHGTSLNNTNTLTSGDNKGYASYALEREVNGIDVPAGHGDFVAAFASTNLGDVSPNTMGAKCIDTGLPCDGKLELSPSFFFH
jgi:neutral ceramidase